jgi:hypothetical protein
VLEEDSAMLYGPTAVERAMKIQEVILLAMRGALSWLQAADIIGGSPRTMRRWRARWAFLTRRAGEAVDKTRRTQVGRALHRPGVDHSPAYAPQARGRSERLNRRLQDRLVNELRVANLRTKAASAAFVGLGPSTWTRFSVTRRNGWWARTIPSRSKASSCRSPSNRAAPPVPAAA